MEINGKTQQKDDHCLSNCDVTGASSSTLSKDRLSIKLFFFPHSGFYFPVSCDLYILYWIVRVSSCDVSKQQSMLQTASYTNGMCESYFKIKCKSNVHSENYFQMVIFKKKKKSLIFYLEWEQGLREQFLKYFRQLPMLSAFSGLTLKICSVPLHPHHQSRF